MNLYWYLYSGKVILPKFVIKFMALYLKLYWWQVFFIYKFIESLSPNFSSLISEMMKTCAIYLNMIWNQFDFAQLLTLRMNSLQMAMNQKFFNLIQENFYQEKVFSIVYFSVALWQQLFNGEYNGLTSKKEHGSQSLLLFLLIL